MDGHGLAVLLRRVRDEARPGAASRERVHHFLNLRQQQRGAADTIWQRLVPSSASMGSTKIPTTYGLAPSLGQAGKEDHEDVNQENEVEGEVGDAPEVRFVVEGYVEGGDGADKDQQHCDDYIPQHSELVVVAD